ncbi:MAG: zinc ABC transporter substrate-binding protein [Kiritimatiellae bacterium]|nr:zinc ABC transporter substrate-binding protein [Kiritimatiellia bacterium]
MNTLKRSCLAVLAAAAVAAQPRAAAEAPRVRAAAALQPVAGLVEELGAGRWSCEALVPAGADPHSWEPSPKTVASLSGVAAFFESGMPFERILADRLRRRDPSLAVVSLSGASAGGAPLGAHSHVGGGDPHGWLSPRELGDWAGTISRRLSVADPYGTEIYAAALAAWRERAEAAETAIRAALPTGLVFAAVHPAYGPFAEAFGLEQVPLETDGHEPGPRALAAAKARLAETGARAILVQNASERRRAAAFASGTGLQIVGVDPLGRDAIATMLEISRALVAPGDADGPPAPSPQGAPSP